MVDMKASSAGRAAPLVEQAAPHWPGLLRNVRAFAIPMRTRFRGITLREGALIEGPAGWASSPRSPTTARASAPAGWPAPWRRRWPGWPAPVRDRVPVNVTVPAVGPEQARAIVAGSGCRTAKVKVAEPGQPEAADLARVQAVREALGPAGKLRVDANAAWDVDQAARMLGALSRFGLEYAEQPCADPGPAGRAAPADGRAAGRRRVDPPGGGPAGRPGRGRGRHRGDQGPAAGRRPGRPGDRPAGGPARRWCPVPWSRRSAWPPGWPWPPPCPTWTTPAAWPRCPAHRRRDGRPAGRAPRRRPAGAPRRVPIRPG